MSKKQAREPRYFDVMLSADESRWYVSNTWVGRLQTNGYIDAFKRRLAPAQLLVADGIMPYLQGCQHDIGFSLEKVALILPANPTFIDAADKEDQVSLWRGSLISKYEVGDPQALEYWKTLMDMVKVMSPLARSMAGGHMFNELPPPRTTAAKYIVIQELCIAREIGDNIPVFPGGVTVSYLDKHHKVIINENGGRFTNTVFATLYAPDAYKNDEEVYATHSGLCRLNNNFLHVAGFFNIKNIVKIHVPRCTIRKETRKGKHEVVGRCAEYYTLAMNPQKQTIQYAPMLRSGEQSTQHRELPLHGVREHIKTYTDKGMFGNPALVGSFVFRRHARGDIKHGINIKDYKIEVPEDEDDNDHQPADREVGRVPPEQVDRAAGEGH